MSRTNLSNRKLPPERLEAAYKERYIKAFDPAVLAAMKRMETTLDAMNSCAPTVHQIN